MALYDEPEHAVTIYGPPTVAAGTSGGDVITWGTVRASGVPCSINTTGASTQDRFAQPGIVITHVVAFGPDVTLPRRGDKLVADDTGLSLHVRGLRTGRACGGVGSLTYADCEEVL